MCECVGVWGDKGLPRVDVVSVQLQIDTRFLGEAAAWSDDPGRRYGGDL